jgi:transposase
LTCLLPECATANGAGARRPWEVADALWERIEPLLPVVERRYRYPGRRRLDQRKVLCGILFVLYTGTRWEFLPQELGFGSGMTCWWRLRDWNEAGVWQQLHSSSLPNCVPAMSSSCPAASVDGSHLRALKGRDATGRSPVDRAKTGSKRHVIVDAHGIPAGRHRDRRQAVPPVKGKRGRPRQRPTCCTPIAANPRHLPPPGP